MEEAKTDAILNDIRTIFLRFFNLLDSLIPAAAQGLVNVYHGVQLLFFGLDQLKFRFQRIPLGKEHLHVISPC